jgi:hypothetical protein
MSRTWRGAALLGAVVLVGLALAAGSPAVAVDAGLVLVYVLTADQRLRS